jgi:hypothetical protein
MLSPKSDLSEARGRSPERPSRLLPGRVCSKAEVRRVLRTKASVVQILAALDRGPGSALQRVEISKQIH